MVRYCQTFEMLEAMKFRIQSLGRPRKAFRPAIPGMPGTPGPVPGTNRGRPREPFPEPTDPGEETPPGPGQGISFGVEP